MRALVHSSIFRYYLMASLYSFFLKYKLPFSFSSNASLRNLTGVKLDCLDDLFGEELSWIHSGDWRGVSFSSLDSLGVGGVRDEFESSLWKLSEEL